MYSCSHTFTHVCVCVIFSTAKPQCRDSATRKIPTCISIHPLFCANNVISSLVHRMVYIHLYIWNIYTQRCIGYSYFPAAAFNDAVVTPLLFTFNLCQIVVETVFTWIQLLVFALFADNWVHFVDRKANDVNTFGDAT